jgi:hypothetical protein
MLDDILNGSREPVELTRISTTIDGVRIDAPALNDVLIAHPSPAAISRCSFRCEIVLPLIPSFITEGRTHDGAIEYIIIQIWCAFK